MNSITPNLLEKFSQEFIFQGLSLTQTIFSHLFSQAIPCNLLLFMSTQGRYAIKSGKASSISREQLDIL
jgi:hypothetical protein